MPTMPPTFRPPSARTKRERGREHDAKRRIEKPWRKWYFTREWREIREGQLFAEPYCRRCRKRGALVMATVVNHMDRHLGNWGKFIKGPFESLCKTCHDSEVQREERAADADKAKLTSPHPRGSC